MRRGWRQTDLAERAKLSRSAVGRAERGEIRRMAYGDLEGLAEAVGGRLDLDFRWQGEALDRLLDEDHTTIVDALAAVYRAAGWMAAVEVSFNVYGERGSIDLLAWHPPTGRVAVNEVKSTVPEAGRTVMTIDRKARLAPGIARARGWRCTGVARFLILPATATARRRIGRHAATFRTAFPLGTLESLAWIRDPITAPPPSGLIFLSNVRGAGDRGRLIGRKRVRRPRSNGSSTAAAAGSRPNAH
jgi:transcriptional regulator with XRE-family HTH domain